MKIVPPTLGRSSHIKEPSQHSPSQSAWSLACWEIPDPVRWIINTNRHVCTSIFDPVVKLGRFTVNPMGRPRANLARFSHFPWLL